MEQDQGWLVLIALLLPFAIAWFAPHIVLMGAGAVVAAGSAAVFFRSGLSSALPAFGIGITMMALAPAVYHAIDYFQRRERENTSRDGQVLSAGDKVERSASRVRAASGGVGPDRKSDPLGRGGGSY